jgi:hypothetical protein
MNLMEYQGKELFRRSGIPVPRSQHCNTPDEVAAFIEKNPGEVGYQSASPDGRPRQSRQDQDCVDVRRGPQSCGRDHGDADAAESPEP